MNNLVMAVSEVDQNNSSFQNTGNLWMVPDSNLLNLLSPGDLAQLTAMVFTRSYHKGEAVFRKGEVSDAFYVLLSGRVKLAVPGALGERVLAFCGTGELFGCVVGSGGHHPSEAVSLQDDTTVITVTHEQLHAVAQQIPAVAVAISQEQARRVLVLERQLERARLPVQARLAYVLLDLSQRFGQKLAGGLVELHLDFRHEEFASMADTTRVRATQALSAWRSMELVRGTRGAYQIHVPGLQALLELLEAEQLLL
ncbi:Crp/Fnr family transcriptional regulator (plasmid) [Deinococcus sp. KNUC1210]|uniref:Crp/Fnr family transcriptional regulator n=1 Tax=Deinococcus sp. KNUC1210 TaxID=2917691 RepID=UPI001EF12FCC|nr:Crp/Fnr family transcriptional regulator [Deinococcus sp. KNUC1210]ULH18313.1 Crp/Fnr family transcriptional regulator [Deinococcus sp. KNUC1210]